MAELDIDRNTTRQNLGQQVAFTTEPVFDEADLLFNIGGDRPLMEQIVVLFLDDARTQLEGLKEAFETGDADGVKRQAHRLKGASANIRAGRLRKVFFDIEQAVAGPQVSEIAGLLATATFELEQFRIRASHTDGYGDGGR